MTFAQRKILMMSAWAGLVVTLAVVLATDKPISWVVIGTLAIIPIAIFNRLWDAPEPTLSEVTVRSRS